MSKNIIVKISDEKAKSLKIICAILGKTQKEILENYIDFFIKENSKELNK